MSGSRRAVLLFVVVVLGSFGPLLAAPRAFSTTPNKVAVVLEHTDTTQVTNVQCVAIPAAGTTAINALTRTFFSMFTTSGQFGRAICWLDGDGQGTSAPSCFGATTDPSWGAWLQKPGRANPASATVGVSSLHVDPGSVLYFQFAVAPAPTYTQAPPTTHSFHSVCSG